MPARNTQEEELLKEVKDLKQNDIKKILRMIHFMKKEIFEVEGGGKPPLHIMDYAGMLKDLSAEEAELFTNAIQRKSMFGEREIGL